MQREARARQRPIPQSCLSVAVTSEWLLACACLCACACPFRLTSRPHEHRGGQALRPCCAGRVRSSRARVGARGDVALCCLHLPRAEVSATAPCVPSHLPCFACSPLAHRDTVRPVLMLCGAHFCCLSALVRRRNLLCLVAPASGASGASNSASSLNGEAKTTVCA
jgi:hypothetical protein